MYATTKTVSSLLSKHVVIVGVGALGSAAAALLARVGVGKITLIDRDCVEAQNLERQHLYTPADVGEAKATAAAAHVKEINPAVTYVSHVTDLVAENSALLHSDLILDGTDNLQTRFLINEFSQKNKVPWIYAAGLRDEGYVHAYVPGAGSCFACVFGETYGLESCATAGILLSTITRVAHLQVQEALKILSGKQPEKKLIRLEDSSNTYLSLPVKKNCEVCKQKYFPYLSGEKKMSLVRLCGTGSYQLRVSALNLRQLEQKLRQIGGVKIFSSGLHFQKLTIFADGRVLIKAKDMVDAKNICAKYIGV